MTMTITDIRYEGFYIAEDGGDLCVEHTGKTLNLLTEAINMVDEIKYDLCEGVVFKDGLPYAELLDMKGNTHYKRIDL